MLGREEIIIVDALLDDSLPGTISVLEGEGPHLDQHREHAHHLSLCDAIRLIEMLSASLATPRFRLVLVSIRAAQNASTLSPELSRCLPRIVDVVVKVIRQ
jgi:hydrogenase maturation protease